MNINTLKYPKIKTNLYPFIKDEETIRFGGVQKGLAREIKTANIEIVWDIIINLNGEKNLYEFIEYGRLKWNLNSNNILTIIQMLVDKGLIEEATPDLENIFSLEEIERYQRNIYLYSWLDKSNRVNHWELQLKLKNARIAVLGLGGVGSNCVSSLARLGIGYLRIVDFDKVEASNLNRQVLFSSSDIGSLKVDVAERKLKIINPEITIDPIDMRVTSVQDVQKVVQDVDLLLLCADEPKYLIDRIVNRATQITKTPWIQGSYASTVVNYSLIIPGKTPCKECANQIRLQDKLFEREFESFQNFGPRNAITAPIAALAGNLVAHEAMNYITGLKSPLSPTFFQLDLFSMEKHNIDVAFYDRCSVCKDPMQELNFEKEYSNSSN